MDDDGSKGGEERGQVEAAAGRGRTAPRRKPVDPALEAIDLDTLLAAHRRHAVTELPRGQLGAGIAVELVGAFVEGCRRRLPDVTGSAPQVMEFLVKHGLMPAMPSPRVIPAALGLVSAVSPLLEARSERTWTAWFARVHDPGARVAEKIRRMTPASQLAVVEAPPVARPLRSAALLAERDRLASERAQIAAERDQLAAERESLVAERDRLAAEREHLVAERDRLAAERDRLVADRQASVGKLMQRLEVLEMSLGQTAQIQEQFDIVALHLEKALAEISVRKVPGHTEADVARARGEAEERARSRASGAKSQDSPS